MCMSSCTLWTPLTFYTGRQITAKRIIFATSWTVNTIHVFLQNEKVYPFSTYEYHFKKCSSAAKILPQYTSSEAYNIVTSTVAD